MSILKASQEEVQTLTSNAYNNF